MQTNKLESFAFAHDGSLGTLHEELRKWRKRVAADRNVKLFMILSNKALEAIVAVLPTTAAELRSVNGMSPGKVREFGTEILELCRRFSSSRPQPASVAVPTGWMHAGPQRPPAALQAAQASRAARPEPDGGGPPPKRARAAAPVVSQESAAAPVAQVPAPTLERGMLTAEQAWAADRALAGESLFITGAAGTGKSFLLRFVIQELEKKHPGEVAITAPTGIAAVNIGGQTIHSFSGVGMLGDKLKEVGSPQRYLLSRIRNVEATCSRWVNTKVLVVDEVSMLEPELFELLDFIGRELRSDRRGFGGLQMLLCGDFLQLPPVDSSRNEGARWCFCFETPAWKRCQLQKGTVILQQPVRQSGDPTFVQLLNHVRAGQCPPMVSELCGRCLVTVKPLPTGIVPTRLYCTNRDVDQENDRKLAALPGATQVYMSQDSFLQRSSNARVTNSSEKKRLLDLLNRTVPGDLRLKVGAQVILLRRQKGYGLVNGSRGVVTDLHENAATVLFDNTAKVKVERERFQHMTATAMGNRTQLPLKLGWALTIHKSQGMTITRAEVHLDEAFSCGQAYVALSRLCGFEGLWIGGRGVSQHNIRAHPKALAFYGLA